MFLLESKRCILREIRIDDATFFYELNSDSEVMRYTGDLPFENIKEASKFLSNYNPYSLTKMGRWAVINKSSNKIIGWCGLKLNPDSKEVDLGYRFFRKDWNKGFATETSQACLKYAFNELKLESIIANVASQNIGSIKVLEKLGFKLESHNQPGTCDLKYRIQK